MLNRDLSLLVIYNNDGDLTPPTACDNKDFTLFPCASENEVIVIMETFHPFW